MFDKYEVANIPESIKSMYLIFGVIGSAKDNDGMMYIKFPGKRINHDSIPIPYKYDLEVTRYLIEINNFPITDIGMQYFELSYKNKVIGKYPVSFIKEKEEVKHGNR
jgi:hypothetical protein